MITGEASYHIVMFLQLDKWGGGGGEVANTVLTLISLFKENSDFLHCDFPIHVPYSETFLYKLYDKYILDSKVNA